MMFEALSGAFAIWYVIADQGSGAEKMYFEDSGIARLWVRKHPEATIVEGPKYEFLSGIPSGFRFTPI